MGSTNFLSPQNLKAKAKKIETYFKAISMASFAITASMHRACSSHQVTKKQQSTHPKQTRSLGIKQPTNVLSLDVEKQKDFALLVDKDEEKQGGDGDDSVPKFLDERWKKGTWDLNMFVKDGKMDWDGVIVAVTDMGNGNGNGIPHGNGNVKRGLKENLLA